MKGRYGGASGGQAKKSQRKSGIDQSSLNHIANFGLISVSILCQSTYIISHY